MQTAVVAGGWRAGQRLEQPRFGDPERVEVTPGSVPFPRHFGLGKSRRLP
jgi:hypothetical protein